MALSVISKTHNSITVSCSYPIKQTTTIPADTAIATKDYDCTITWSWIWQSGAWQQNGWSHNAPASRAYGPDVGGYRGTVSLHSVSVGARPSTPTGTGTANATTTRNTTGTATYSGSVTKPESSTTTGANITSVTMYLNGAVYGSGAGGNNFTYTFSGLQPSTPYTLAIHWFENGTGLGSNSDSTTTSAAPDVTPPYLSISISDITETSFKVNYNAVDNVGGSGVNGYTIGVGYGAGLSYENLSNRGTDYNASGGNLVISGCVPNTWYTAGVRVIDKAGNYTTQTANVRTLSLIPSAPSIIGRSEGGLALSWNSISGATSYELSYKPSINSVWSATSTSGASAYIGGLAYGLSYDFRVRAYADGWSGYSYVSVGTVNPKTPTISGNYDGTNVQIYTAGLGGTTFDYIVIERLNKSTGALVDQKSVSNSGDGVTWAIPSNTVGQFRWRAYSTKGSVSSVNYSNYVEFARPLSFNWTGGNKVQGSTITILASDWNTLQSRVNEFRAYKALGATSFTSVSRGNTITAGLYNQLANSINAMNSPGGQIATVSKDQKLTAYAINRLNACLNAIT